MAGELLWLNDTHSFDEINTLSSFPTYKALNGFIKTRLRTAIASDPYYNSLVDKNLMSLETMKIRNSKILFRTSSQGSSMEGIDLDAAYLDEFDRISELAEQSALEGMSSSKYHILRRWSTPTVSHYKIHKLYEESDQRKYFHKCPHCGYDQVLDYDKNIVLVNKDGIDPIGKAVMPGTYQYVCQKCGKPLDRWYTGHWEITAPGGGRTHGYAISQMNAVFISADQLKQKEMRAPSKSYFYNYSLGLPYEAKEGTFYEEDITNNMTMPERPHNRDNYSLVSCGIDWGENFHHLVFIGLKKDSHELDLINLKRVPRSKGAEAIEQDIRTVIQEIEKYNPDIILPDIGFSGNYVDLLLKHFGARKVYGVKVRSAKTNGDINAHFSESDNTVTIDKLTQNMLVMASMKRGNIKFWRPLDFDLKLLIQHWDNVIIRTDEEENTKTHEIEFVKRILRKDDDHYSQSMVYSYVGLQELLNQKEELEQNKVLTTTISDDIYDEPTDINKEISELNFNV